MYEKYKKQANIWFSVGIAIIAIPMIFTIPVPESLITFWLFIGTVFAMWGCSSYAKAKGHSRLWGILSLFVIFLPNKNKENV